MNKEETQTRSTIMEDMEDKEDHAEASCERTFSRSADFQQIHKMKPHRSTSTAGPASINYLQKREAELATKGSKPARLPPKSTLTDSRGDKIGTMQAPRDAAREGELTE